MITIERVHISRVIIGDVVIHNGISSTVCKKDLDNTPFMGPTLFGDSYRLGRDLVKRVEEVLI